MQSNQLKKKIKIQKFDLFADNQKSTIKGSTTKTSDNKKSSQLIVSCIYLLLYYLFIIILIYLSYIFIRKKKPQ